MIVGTAGHIDHGKSALVRALTGTDTDRLKEEKARGISIDLGFAYMSNADGTILGFVDVPGHEKFVRNMLAGATGIDFVLLAVAADDGVMPQTIEHLAIVSLLDIPRGLVAMTKVDLVSAQRRAQVEAEIRTLVRHTRLAEADIISVSVVTGEGIGSLRDRLFAASREYGTGKAGGVFRLAVDRCFSLRGVGTIVTGSVLSGEVAVGDHLVISPSGLSARVRSIHSQNRPAEQGRVGDRCALNLSGERISKQAVRRGDVLLHPSLHAPTERIDASFRLLDSEERAIVHWTPVRLHHATVEINAHLALIEGRPIAPGDSAWVQIVTDRPIAVAAGDRFILRDISGSRTLGGGRLVDLRGPHRRRGTSARIAELNARALDDPETALSELVRNPPYHLDLVAFARDRTLELCAVEGTAVRLKLFRARNFALTTETRSRIEASAQLALAKAHKADPKALGLPGTKLAAMVEPRLPIAVMTIVLQVLTETGCIVSENGMLRLPEHRAGLDSRDEMFWARIAPFLSGADRFRPLLVTEIATALREREEEVRRILRALARLRKVIEIAPDRFFLRTVVVEIAPLLVELARGRKDEQFSVVDFRDRLNNGRKVAIQILEYFDRQGVTLRRGDLRKVDPRRLDLFASSSDSAIAR